MFPEVRGCSIRFAHRPELAGGLDFGQVEHGDGERQSSEANGYAYIRQLDRRGFMLAIG